MSNDLQEMTEVSARTIGGNQTGRERIPTDNPSPQITTLKLDGTNYLTLSRLAVLSIQRRGLYKYLTGSAKRAEETDSLYYKFIAENSLVMSWLLHSMQPNIGRGYMLLTTAHKIWNAVLLTYF